jgi:acetylornithine/succinyldiaminopimelate/putrescine aminotransferase
MNTIKRSLKQLLGEEYIEAVVDGAVLLLDIERDAAQSLADKEIDFFPDSFADKMDSLLDKVGEQITPGLAKKYPGAPTKSFSSATSLGASPLSGIGYLRLGQDGRLYLTTKSEHYHAPLGHNFPGYKLIDNARALGITNATHNNTRGYITRLLERELVRTVNGVVAGNETAVDKILASHEPHVLNRVINLETGSLACEAGIKMMLARFYELEDTGATPKYNGRTPVLFVMEDHRGGSGANYHGTTIFAQMLRGLWPKIYARMEDDGIFKVCHVKINDFDDFKTKFEKYNKPPYKVAGFIHEIILMNYGGIKLEKDYLKKAYELCHANDTPVMCDEIQSCMWYPGMYLFREYGLNPDFMVIGKGFPGGQYAASKIIGTYEMDNLTQFGALVTNGQEELASLAYLITMAFSQANEACIRESSTYYEDKVRALSKKYPGLIDRVDGMGYLLSIIFHKSDDVKTFTMSMNKKCIDISSQTYKKSKCQPAVLTKPPIIATEKMIDYFVDQMDCILKLM